MPSPRRVDEPRGRASRFIDLPTLLPLTSPCRSARQRELAGLCGACRGHGAATYRARTRRPSWGREEARASAPGFPHDVSCLEVLRRQRTSSGDFKSILLSNPGLSRISGCFWMHKIFSDVRQYASTSCHFEGNAKSDVSSLFVVTGNFF